MKVEVNCPNFSPLSQAMDIQLHPSFPLLSGFFVRWVPLPRDFISFLVFKISFNEFLKATPLHHGSTSTWGILWKENYEKVSLPLDYTSWLNLTPRVPPLQALLCDIQPYFCPLSTIINTTTKSGPCQLLFKNVTHSHWEKEIEKREVDLTSKSPPSPKVPIFSQMSYRYCLYFPSHLSHLLFSLQSSELCLSHWFLCCNHFYKNSVLSFGITGVVGHFLFQRLSYPFHSLAQKNTPSFPSIFDCSFLVSFAVTLLLASWTFESFKFLS